MDCLHNAQENLVNITGSPLPHRAPMSALLPCLPEITPARYCSLSSYWVDPNVGSSALGVTALI